MKGPRETLLSGEKYFLTCWRPTQPFPALPPREASSTAVKCGPHCWLRCWPALGTLNMGLLLLYQFVAFLVVKVLLLLQSKSHLSELPPSALKGHAILTFCHIAATSWVVHTQRPGFFTTVF